MMEYFLISVIVPVYNVEKYLTRCIESIINQTYKNLEIILVDDGSTDGSAFICDEYAKNDLRIKVIHKKNGGVSLARNTGLDVVSGEYIMMIDADDYLALDAAEHLMKLTNRYNLTSGNDIIQFRYAEVKEDEAAGELDRTLVAEDLCSTKDFFNKAYEIGGEAVSPCSKLYGAKLFSNLRYKEGIRYEDEYMSTKMLPIVNRIIYTNDILYFYVMHEESFINSVFSPVKMDAFFVIEDRIDFLKEQKYDDLRMLEYNKYFYTLLRFYCGAKSASYENECKIMLSKMRVLLKGKKLNIKGSIGLAYRLAKINVRLIDVYWIMLKLLKKI